MRSSEREPAVWPRVKYKRHLRVAPVADLGRYGHFARHAEFSHISLDWNGAAGDLRCRFHRHQLRHSDYVVRSPQTRFARSADGWSGGWTCHADLPALRRETVGLDSTYRRFGLRLFIWWLAV